MIFSRWQPSQTRRNKTQRQRNLCLHWPCFNLLVVKLIFSSNQPLHTNGWLLHVHHHCQFNQSLLQKRRHFQGWSCKPHLQGGSYTTISTEISTPPLVHPLASRNRTSPGPAKPTSSKYGITTAVSTFSLDGYPCADSTCHGTATMIQAHSRPGQASRRY